MADKAIGATPAQLTSHAKDIRNIRKIHDDEMKKLEGIVKSLDDAWSGDAQKAFRAEFDALKPKFTAFSEMLEKHAKALDSVASSFDNTDKTLKNEIQKGF